jgi:hypothetical protein
MVIIAQLFLLSTSVQSQSIQVVELVEYEPNTICSHEDWSVQSISGKTGHTSADHFITSGCMLKRGRHRTDPKSNQGRCEAGGRTQCRWSFKAHYRGLCRPAR